MRRPALLVLLGSIAAGCVHAPPATRPATGIQVPETWTAPGAATAAADALDDRWWLDFDDARLTALIEEALEHNLDLIAAAARLDQAAATARVAGAELFPALSGGFTGTRRQQIFVGFPIPGREGNVLSTRSTNYGVDLTLSWEADLWGRLSAQAREGLALYQASRADLAGAQLSIAGQTAKAWFAVAEAGRQVELTRRTVASFQRSADLVRARFEQGVRPPLDVRLALAQLATAEAALESRRRGLDAAIRQLEILAGRYPSGRPEDEGALLAVPAPVPGGIPADLVARRPDLAAAERRAVAAAERLNVSRAALYPRLALTASAGTSSNALGDLVDGDFSVWSLIGNLTAPLFQGGRLRAGVDLAAAGVDERLATYIGTALRAYAEVESSLTAEQLLASREAALREATRQSQAAEELALDRYRNGLIEYVTVLDAQRRTFDSESALLAVQRERLDNRVDLYLALGGGFRAEDALGPVAPDPTTEPGTPQEASR